MKRKWIKGTYPAIIMVLILLLPISSFEDVSYITLVSGENMLRSTGTITGENMGDNFGWNATGVGDINGDGYDDILVGSPHANNNLISWWDNEWIFRISLIFNNSGQSETLTNFPVLVTLDPVNFNYSNSKSDGSDIRFIDADGTTELKYHIEKWNPAGESHIWVNVTEIKGGSSYDSIWMYYGNPLAGNFQDASGTYDKDFMGVWHLNESSGTLYDATSNNHDGTQSGGVTYGAAGQVDGALYFDGNDDMISVADDAGLEPPNDMTIEAWVNFQVLSSTLGRPQTPVAKRHTVAPWQSYELLLNSGDNFRFGWANTSGPNEYAGWNGPPDLNTWYYIVGVKDGDTLRFYLNGGTTGCFTNTAEGTMLQSDLPLRIGDDENEVVDGTVDEVRLSDTARSADWIRAQYLSITNDFITFGPESRNSWWNNDWRHRMGLKFDNSQQDETLMNFPVLITLNPSNFNYSRAKADGTDLRFIDPDGITQQKYHIEKWNPAGESYIWVNVSSIDGGSSMDNIWMYYGNPLAYNSQDIWGTYDRDFKGVWHLNETGGDPMDATAYANHGTIYNNVIMGVNGKIDGAADFEGDAADDDYIGCGNDPSLHFDTSKDYTWSAWMFRHENTNWDTIFSKFSWTNYGIRVMVQDGGSPKIAVGNHDNEFVTTLNSINLNTWYHITMVFKSSLPTLPAIFINGNRQATVGVATFLSDTNTQFDIGYGVLDEAWNGALDEVQVSGCARTDDWIMAQYLSTSNNFITFGLEEQLRPDSGAAYLFFGYEGISTSDLRADSANVTIYGSNPGDLFGWSLSDAGDHNGDSYSDIIIGAPGYDNGRGRAYIFRGRKSSSWSSEMEADPDADQIITGENQGDELGRSVGNVGDVGRENYFEPWSFKKRITILASQVTADLTDFPVVLQFKDPDLAKNARSDGLDIVFTEMDGKTLLDFEIEYYDDISGDLVAWIRIPFLSSLFDTDIYMYYGNPNSRDHSNPKGVWDPGYAGVWHLSEDGSGIPDEFSDSSVYGNDGQGGSGTPTHLPAKVSGKVGFAQVFDGVDDHINCGAEESLNITGNTITLEAWINFADLLNDMGPFNRKGWFEGYNLHMENGDGRLWFQLTGSSHALITSQTMSSDIWNHVVGVYDGTKMYAYINGVPDTITLNKTDNIDPAGQFEFWIGHGDQPTGQTWSNPWNGMVDEVRISSVPRSLDWIATQYNNQNDTSSFFIFHPEEINPSNWNYRKQIVIDSGKVASDLTDFPVLVKITDYDLVDHARSDGFDIVFTSWDGWTKLDHEIEFYDDVSGELIAWVKVPILSSTSDTIIYMYYGSSYALNLENGEGVWSNGYIGVYHMDESTGNIANSVSDKNDGTREDTPTRGTGRIGYGQDFTGSTGDDRFLLGDLGLADGIQENLTISFWVKADDASLDDWARVIVKRDDTDSNTLWGAYFDDSASDKGLMFLASGDTGAYTIAKSVWVYVSFTYDGSTKDHYHNGSWVRDDTGSSGPISATSSTSSVSIGARVGGSQNFGGSLDEVRVSNVTHSADWIMTEYFNQNDPLSFYMIKSEEILPQNWYFKRPVTILASQVAQDLSDFPAMVRIIDKDLLNKGQKDLDDIVFTGVDGRTKLDHEIESYDSDSGELICWVRIPFLSSTSNTLIYMHYGNPEIGNQQRPQGVWKNGYVAVYHMMEESGDIANSVSSSNHGIRVNTPSRERGQVGFGQEFTGSGMDDHFNLGDLGLANGLTVDFSFSTWAYIRDQDLEDWAKILSKRNDADNDYIYHISFDSDGTDKDIGCHINNDGSSYVPIIKDTWVYLTLSYNGLDRVLYANTTELLNGTGSTGPLESSQTDVTIGARSYSQNFGGMLDEVRFSNTVRSPSWIATEYNNQKDIASFISVGVEIGGKKRSDVIVGAPGYSNDRGRAYIFLGHPFASNELQASKANMIINGSMAKDRVGESVSGNGNLDNVEYHDIIVGAPGVNGHDGAIYVFYGNQPLKQLLSTGDSNVMIAGGGGSGFGSSLSYANDMNADGFDDIIVGSPNNNGDTGAAYIFYGGPSMLSSMSVMDADVSMFGGAPQDMFGKSLSTSGDLNGDGFYDLVVGVNRYDDGAITDCGAIYVFEGGPFMNGISDWVFFGDEPGDLFGWSVSTSGNINGDQLNYIIVTAPQNDKGGDNAGRMYILSATYKPSFSDVMASPPVQIVGGNVNISCNALAPMGIDSVWVNITLPNGGFVNQSMSLGNADTWFFEQSYAQLGLYQFTIWANNTLGDWSQSEVLQFRVVNQAPDLSFGQVNPVSGYLGSSFNFAVTYTDLDDQPPQQIVVNITGYGTFDLLETDPFDMDFTDGKNYDLDLSGFPIGHYTLNFAASDTTGFWTETGTYQFDVLNRAPWLSDEGVDPLSGHNDDEFNFTIRYWDSDEHPPSQIIINISGLGVFPLGEVDPLDNIYSDGKLYHFTQSGLSQGLYQFSFAANDSLGLGAGSSLLEFNVQNRAPSLTSHDVFPLSGYTDDWFNFTVIFTDLDDQPPGIITVNITNLGTFQLHEIDEADNNFIDGKGYYFNTSLTQGSYTFHFAANDTKGEWAEQTPEMGYPIVSPRPGIIDILDLVVQFGDTIFLNASVMDDEGMPIVNENLTFYIDLNSNGEFESGESVITATSSSQGRASYGYPFSISKGTYNYSVYYTGSDDYSVQDDRALITVNPKPATLTASIVAVEAGQTAFLNASLIDDSHNPVVNEQVALYLDRNRDGFYQASEVIVTVPTTVNGLASINYWINLPPENYGFWAKFEGTRNYEVEEIKGLVTVKSTGNIPPTILDVVPHQTKKEDSIPWTLDLTQYEDDVEDFGTNLKWYLEGVDTKLYTVTGENSTNDVLTFIPKENAFGSDEVILYLVDSGGNWDSQVLWINLTPVNDLPYFHPIPPDIYVHYDDPSDPLDDPGPWDYSFYVHDIETPVEDLVITTSEPTSKAGDGYVQVNGLKVSYHYPQSRVGDTVFVFLELTDGTDSTQTMIIVNITSDWIPELSSELPDIVLYENSTLHNAFDLDDFFFDRDQDVIYYSSGNTNINIRIHENNSVDISAPFEWVGTELVTFRARDPTGAIVEDTIMVTVLPVNDGPVISNVPDLVVHYDYSYSFDLSPYIHDPDNLTSEIILWTSESSQYIEMQPWNNLGIVINYPEIFNGMKIPITLYVSDGLELSSQNITISVSHDFPPEIVEHLPDVYFDEDAVLENAFVLSDYFLDVDSNILFYSNGSNMINVTIHKDLSVRFSAPLDWYGMETVTFRATDAQGALAEDTVSVYVVPVNDPPKIHVISRQDKESGDEWVLDLSEYIHDVDNDNSELTISVDSLYGSDYVSLAGHILIFKYPDDVNEDYVSITVSDGEFEAKTGFIVAIKSKEPLAPSIWDLIPWNWVFSTIFISLIGALVVYRKTTRYKVYEAFLIHEKGLSVGHASKEERSELEDIIVSGMFIAVQDFIGDTFSNKSSEDWELDEMRFGDNKILIERGKSLFLAVVFEGNGKRLRLRVKKLLGDINRDYGEIFKDWNGDMSYLDGINMALMELITKGKTPRKEPRSIPVKPTPQPEIANLEPVREPEDTILAKPDANLRELNEIISWGKELTKIENITGEVDPEKKCGENNLEERYECPICGIEVADGTIFCPNCKARSSQSKE